MVMHEVLTSCHLNTWRQLGATLLVDHAAPVQGGVCILLLR